MLVSEQSLTVPELAKQTYLRPEQRQDLERSRAEIHAILSDPHLRAVADEEALQKQLDRETELLERGTPPEYDTQTKNKLFRSAKVLEADIQSTMLTRDEMERPIPSNIDKYMRWHYGPYNGDQKMAALRTIKQILDPNNAEPHFLSLAGIRDGVDENHRVNLPVYRDNYEKIQWEEVVEENLIRDMDTQEYQKFLEFKVLDWSKVSICKEMSWSSKQYEAALIKLRIAHGMTPVVESTKTNEPFDDAPGTPSGHSDWPKSELKAIDVPVTTFCKEWGESTGHFYDYIRKGEWPERSRINAVKALERLQVTHDAKAKTEPVYGSLYAEPVDDSDVELANL